MKEYIEREAVMQAFSDFVWNSNHSDLVPAPTWNHAVDIVRDIPAADVVEVRHAKDVYKQYTKHHCEFMCSLCGGWIGVIEGGDCDFNYCPNCGAKMDGGADDGIL